MRSEGALERRRLGFIVCRGAGAMRVDVLNVRGPKPAVRKRAVDRSAHAAGIGAEQVAGVRAHAEAYDLAEDIRRALPRVFEALDHHDRGALADYQSFAVARERPAGVGRE